MNIDYAITFELEVQLNLGIGISISDYNFGKKLQKVKQQYMLTDKWPLELVLEFNISYICI